MKKVVNILGFIGIELFFSAYFLKIFKFDKMSIVTFSIAVIVSTIALVSYIILRRTGKMI